MDNPEEAEKLSVRGVSSGPKLGTILFEDEEGNTPQFFSVADGSLEQVVPALKYGFRHGVLDEVARLLKNHGVEIPGVSDLSDPDELKQLGFFDQEP